MKEIIKDIKVLSQHIPNFIDPHNPDHKRTFDIISEILLIFKTACVERKISKKSIEELSNDYFTYLLMIYKLNTDIIKQSMEYIQSISESILRELENIESYLAASNLYAIIKSDE